VTPDALEQAWQESPERAAAANNHYRAARDAWIAKQNRNILTEDQTPKIEEAGAT